MKAAHAINAYGPTSDRQRLAMTPLQKQKGRPKAALASSQQASNAYFIQPFSL
jgi:hypothetical protein